MIIKEILKILISIKEIRTTIIKIRKTSITSRGKFCTDLEPSQHAFKTKWNYKKFLDYYFVPLLSHSRNGVHFIDLTGPWCKKCDHLLYVDDTFFGSKFKCGQCLDIFSPPKELADDFQKRLFEYFKSEYANRRIE